MRRAYFSLGSNMGDRGEHLAQGIAITAGDDEFRVSQVYETEPVGGVSQHNYWNLVLEVNTEATLRELLERARSAERSRQRVRSVRWGPRTLDVDVLLVGNETSDDPDILIPHPRMYERSFVLMPLQELAPELVSDGQLRAGEGRVLALGTLESLR